MAQMPFSPCEAGVDCTETDASVRMLRHVYGDIINALATGADPDTVAASTSTNLLATMFNYFNSGILIIGSLVASYVVVMGAVNTANDGEALGKNWSSAWTPVRIVSGAAVLLPSTTGYSFIQVIVLMFSLWAVGFANGVYKAGMAMGLLSPDGVVEGVNRPGSYYGLREFARNYLAVSYCAKVANTVYSDGVSAPPDVRSLTDAGRVKGVPDKEVIINGRTEQTYYIKDRNDVTNLAGGHPFCGSVNIAVYDPQPMDDTVAAALENVRVNVQNKKRDVAGDLIADLDNWVNGDPSKNTGWPTDINQPGWENVDSNEFNRIVALHEDRLANELVSSISNDQNGVDTGLDAYLKAIIAEGWAGAGGWFQRVGNVRTQITQVIAEPVGTVTQPSLSALPSDARASLLSNSVTTATETVAQKAEEKPDYVVSHTVSRIGQNWSNSLADLGSMIPRDINSDFNADAIRSDIDHKMSSFVNTFMLDIVETATGANSPGTTPLCGMAGQMGGSIYRMKCIGDYLNAANTMMIAADIGLKSGVTGTRVVGGLASMVKGLGTGLDTDKVTTPLWDWIEGVPIKYLSKMSSYAEPLAFYFGVVLPSLPYGIFMIVVVGWLLAVLQSTVAASLWAVMHMTPDRTFVGSQTQGYLLLLSLFARPALAIMGIFASILISDTVIDFIAKSFFAMRGAVVSSTGTVGIIAEYSTMMWWLIAFGLLLLPVLYMIFGLPQILPDHVLRWIGVGISDLGETNAILETRRGVENADTTNKILTHKSKTVDPAITNPSKDNPKQGNHAGEKPVNITPQGVVPKAPNDGGNKK